MKKLALLIGLLASSVSAQVGYQNTKNKIDLYGMSKGAPCMFGDANNWATFCSVANPLPVTVIGGSSSGTSSTSNAEAIPGSDAGRALAIQGVTAGKPIPVTGTFWQSVQPVSLGSLPALPTGSNVIGSIGNTSFGATQSGSWNVGITGSVNVSNTGFAASQSGDWNVSILNTSLPVTGQFWQSVQPVSGSVSVSNFPTSIQVSNFPDTRTINGTVGVNNFPDVQNINGNVAVSNFPSVQHVTVDNQPVTQPVSGSVSVSNWPSTQTIGGNVNVLNFPASFQVSNFPTSTVVSNFPTTFNVGNFPSTQNVVVTSSALPTGAATSALQSTGNTNLASIDSKLTNVTATTTDAHINAVNAGKCFTYAIPLTSVPVGSYLNVVLTNSTGSGETFMILDRRYSQTSTVVLKYSFFVNPPAITGTSKAGANQLTGSAVTSAVTMTYNTSTTAMTGTSVGEMPIPANGLENPPQTAIRTMPPGSSIGYMFGGVGGVLSQASSFTFTLQGCKQ